MFYYNPAASHSWAKSLAQNRRPVQQQRATIEQRAIANGAAAIRQQAQQQSEVIQASADFIIAAARKAGIIPPPPPKRPRAEPIGPDGRVLTNETARFIVAANERRLGLA